MSYPSLPPADSKLPEDSLASQPNETTLTTESSNHAIESTDSDSEINPPRNLAANVADPSPKRSSANKKTLIIDAENLNDSNSLSLSDSESGYGQSFTAPPWYYQGVIELLKPFYRLSVWRRSKDNENYQDEVAQRFGHRYPNRPIAAFNPIDSDLMGDGCNKQNLGNDLDNQGPLASRLALSNRDGSMALSQSHKGVIWCHAVSLGETNTVAPLLEALMAAGFSIWLTNTTQTGFARGEKLFASQIAKGVVSHSYVPIDSDKVIDEFLAHVQPIAALFVETELWASILSKLAAQKIPSILVNGRLSEASFKRYQKISRISAGMMRNLSLIIAQDADSAKRFRQLGAASAKIRLSGSLKWVISTPSLLVKDNQNQFGSTGPNLGMDADIDANGKDTDSSSSFNQSEGVSTATSALNSRPIWVAASTHEGEEAIALEVHQRLLANDGLSDSLLILVPRHPERFDSVAQLIERSGLRMARRSLGETIIADTQVYLADSMGELMRWYQLAQVALVGGSLVKVGGHNPIEALSLATPVVMGPYTQSCHEVVRHLQALGALYQISSGLPPQQMSGLLHDQLLFWLTHPTEARRAGLLGLSEVKQQQRILPQQLEIIVDVIKRSNLTKTNQA
ncbi:MAG: 3-deoxy-D-manno-octulosonic acid transferase [Psychrobacter sp.]|nr:3-deoxy-D-manno-octulosonic acid transferase [Psychrobacter sp.]